LLIPDNLKSAVTKACRYEPDLNPTYQQLAAHYDTVIVPARPYKPKDYVAARIMCWQVLAYAYNMNV
jgi:transposase